METQDQQWDAISDIVIVGTGCAGLTAALAAHEAGADVLIIEKTGLVGGTTAVSAGALWIPNNHHMQAMDEADSADEAITYITSQTDGRGDAALIERFVTVGPVMAQFVEAQSSLRLAVIPNFPDYHPEMVGGKFRGRSLDAGTFDTRTLGDWATCLRRSPVFGMLPLSINELREYGLSANPFNTPMALLQERLAQGIVSFGTALVGHLLKALLDRGIEPRLNCAAQQLITKNGRVVGVVIEQDGQTQRIGARRGVILASGGFEWNPKLTAQFLSGQPIYPQSPPANQGDGLRMAMAIGADLANLNEAWWCPVHLLPGEQYDGQPLHRGDFTTMRGLPHTMIVNRQGERFVNESLTYNDLTKVLLHLDPNHYEHPNLPAWMILDQGYLSQYTLHTYFPGMPLPDWLIRADTLAELAGKLGITPERLTATADRFNAFAESGVDLDFGRGLSAHDRDYGDAKHRPNPSLGAIAQPPFCALPIQVGTLGTKGGVRVDENSQARHVNGGVIAGLYAVGNVMASAMGAGYPGGGATIGAAMTFGYIAGQHAAAAIAS
ncbi:MAG: FAD-dependent oxidoreductase [Caldilineaceae bacterium]